MMIRNEVFFISWVSITCGKMAPAAVDVAVCEWNYCNFNVKCELEWSVPVL